MQTNFHLFGPVHLGILASVLLLPAILAASQRKFPSAARSLRLGIASLLIADTVLWYADLAHQGQLRFPDGMPLELCDATLLLTIVTLLKPSPAIFDVAYYTALAGASMALLTPNLWEPFPSLSTVQFFMDHGLVVASILYLVWSGQARPRPGSVFRALIAVNIYAAFVGAFDFVFKTDFMYLRAKPANASLLDILGPWPWYIASAEAVAFVLFLLLYLPFQISAGRVTRSASNARD